MKTTASLFVAAGAVALALAACGPQTQGETPAPAEAPAEAPAQAVAETSAEATGPAARQTGPVSAAEEREARAGESSQAVFPVQYRGSWDYSDDGCAKDESGTRFSITATQIKGYEDTSTLTALETLEDQGDAIRVVLDNESADGDRTIVQILRLSPVAGISLRVEQNGRTVRANRCDPV